jgi:hypothetical protein
VQISSPFHNFPSFVPRLLSHLHFLDPLCSCIVFWCSPYRCQWSLWSVLSFLFHHQYVVYYHSPNCANVNFVLLCDIPYSS